MSDEPKLYGARCGLCDWRSFRSDVFEVPAPELLKMDVEIHMQLVHGGQCGHADGTGE